MPKTRLISPGIANHSLKKNLVLNDKHITNDGDHGIKIHDNGYLQLSTNGEAYLIMNPSNANGNSFIAFSDSLDASLDIGTNWDGYIKFTNHVTPAARNIEFRIKDTGDIQMAFTGEGRLMIDKAVVGTPSPQATLHPMSDDCDQLRLGYDTLNYSTFATAIDGALTLTTVGANNAVVTVDTLTPTPSDAWEASQSHSLVSQTESDGSGTGIKCSIDTTGGGAPIFVITSGGTGYAVDEEITFTDPHANTSNTAVLIVASLSSTEADITLAPDGDIVLDAGFVTIDSTTGINLQEGGSTIIGIDTSRNIATTNTAQVDLDCSGVLSLNSTGGALNIGDHADAQAINVGTGAAARTITIGNTNGATALVLKSGTGRTDITGQLIVDYDETRTTASQTHDGMGFYVTKTGAISSGTNTVKGMAFDVDCIENTGGTTKVMGFDIDIRAEHASNSGTVEIMGVKQNLSMNNTNGSSRIMYGLYNVLQSGNPTEIYGIWQKVSNGKVDIRCVSSANVTDYFDIATGAEGATTLSTVDTTGGNDGGHFTIDADGEIILDPVSGITKFYKAGDGTDYASLTVATNGVTTIATTDGSVGTTIADLTLDIDGEIKLESANGTIEFYGSSGILGNFDDDGDLTVQGDFIPNGAIRSKGTGGLVLGTAGNTDGVAINMIVNTGETDGKDLTISAGSTVTTSYNLNGGDLILKAGGGDGVGTSAMMFYTKQPGVDAAVERMRIHSDGNVGIGVANPDSLLEIFGTTGPAQLKLSYDSANYISFTVEANGVTTLKTVDEGVGISADFTVDADGDIILDVAQDNIYFANSGTNIVDFNVNASAGVSMKFMSLLDTSDYFMIATTTLGATTISTEDDGGVNADLTFNIDGFIDINSAAGEDITLDSGGHVKFDGCAAGFNRHEETWSVTDLKSTSGTDDTDIDFRVSNKIRLEMTGDIAQMNLVFPAVSGNFLMVCNTDGDHDVAVWKVWESDLTAATVADVMWAGGSLPAFTDTGNDIVSFYWDADEQTAYGVASLAFAIPS